MTLDKNLPSVWPGYVAAIASLVLSLLLLLAILVFALSQVGSIVSNYMQELVRNTLRAEQDAPTPTSSHEGLALPVLKAKKMAVAPTPAPEPDAANKQVPATPGRAIELIFAAHLDAIPEAQRAEVALAIQQLHAPQTAIWEISATVLTGDALMQRASYRLLLAVKTLLVAQGISPRNMALRLDKSDTPPRGYAQGEIVVHLGPVLATPEAQER